MSARNEMPAMRIKEPATTPTEVTLKLSFRLSHAERVFHLGHSSCKQTATRTILFKGSFQRYLSAQFDKNYLSNIVYVFRSLNRWIVYRSLKEIYISLNFCALYCHTYFPKRSAILLFPILYPHFSYNEICYYRKQNSLTIFNFSCQLQSNQNAIENKKFLPTISIIILTTAVS